MNDEAEKEGVWFVYDGECPLCNMAAHALRIKENCGPLHLVDARVNGNNPLLEDIKQKGLNLDEGMVIRYRDQFYHGKDALRFMAEYGTPDGWFNRLNRRLFQSENASRLSYPWLRGIRNFLLKVRNVPQIGNLSNGEDPVFKSIFGTDWDRLPRIMHRHYANRAYYDDVTIVEGHLKIESSPVGRLLKPFFWLARTLVPYEGDNIPCTVRFTTDAKSNAFCFDRTFHFPDRKPYHFRSAMIPIHGSEIVEKMSLGLCWRMNYSWNGEKVVLSHKGYALKLLGFLIPLPLTILIGKGYAEEIPLNDDEFIMMTEIRHFLWGKIYGYSGSFRVTKDR